MPLKYLRNFWRSFEMPLINCKTEFKFKCSVLSAAGNDIQMLTLILLILLSKTQNYMFL